MLGLVKAVDRFDPDYGAAFSSFAATTIEGELKRYFRDRTWTVRVPRSAKELHLAVRRATEELSQQNGRSPNVDELAEHLRVDRDDVLARSRGHGRLQRRARSTRAGSDDDGAVDRQGFLADDEVGFDQSDDRRVVVDLLDRLPDTRAGDRPIALLRGSVAGRDRRSRSGISQMHVSRLLRQSFEQMRALDVRRGLTRWRVHPSRVNVAH